MRNKLFLLAALLLPAIAYGANPSADLSVQVIPAGSSGPISGSILPPGNWTLGFSDEFGGASIDASKWSVHQRKLYAKVRRRRDDPLWGDHNFGRRPVAYRPAI
jgi:hypothetical protein